MKRILQKRHTDVLLTKKVEVDLENHIFFIGFA